MAPYLKLVHSKQGAVVVPLTSGIIQWRTTSDASLDIHVYKKQYPHIVFCIRAKFKSDESGRLTNWIRTDGLIDVAEYLPRDQIPRYRANPAGK